VADARLQTPGVLLDLTDMLAPNLTQLRSTDGNASIVLPQQHQGGRVTLRREGERNPCWISHGLPATTQSVYISVWNGEFCGPLRGASILPAGSYLLVWHKDKYHAQPLAQLVVDAHQLLDTPLANATAAANAGWEVREESAACPEADSEIEPAFAAFRAAAMHGRLSASFRITSTARQASVCGLVCRYYSKFHHLCVTYRCDERGGASIRLSHIAASKPDVPAESILAERLLQSPASGVVEIEWSFNGEQHSVWVDGVEVLSARDGYMGGVDVVGVFTRGSCRCERATMISTQRTQRHDIEMPAYSASIRAGNIDRLQLRHSAAPHQNLCWESGIQFGHIGGSEIKFTQGATLQVLDEGPVATTVAWRGPMPKLVEQASDVRGMAEGVACFYRDHIVVADDVLARTRRSVGPDVDLLARLLCGHRRVALGSSNHFVDWALPQDGTYAFVEAGEGGAFPALAAFPIQLADEHWWLTAMILLRRPRRSPPAASSVFAWRCPSALTARHDFRCAPTEPGTEYGFTIVLGWMQSTEISSLEQTLLRQRDGWLSPMTLEVAGGAAIAYPNDAQDAPAEAHEFAGCFDLRNGRYVVRADSNELSITCDAAGVERSHFLLEIRNWPEPDEVHCALDDVPLVAGKDFAWQRCSNQGTWISIYRTLRGRGRLSLAARTAGRI
jgi:hypothetical protein